MSSLNISRFPRGFAALVLCGSAAALQVHAAPSGSAPLSPADPADPADSERRAIVVASYSGGEVTVGEVEDAIGTATPSSLEHQSKLSTVQHWYNQTLRTELLQAEARRRGYADSQIMRLRLAELASDLMRAEVIGEPLKTYVPSDEALQHFFQTRQVELGAPELRRVVELVVASEAEARALIERFQAAQGAALRELIKQHSLDEASKKDDGYSRYFDNTGKLDDKSSSVDPALAKAAFSLPAIGMTSNVVPLSGDPKRFAVIKLTDLRPAYTPTFQQALPVMKKLMTDERREQERMALEDAARARFKPVVRPELLNSLPAELVPPEAQ